MSVEALKYYPRIRWWQRAIRRLCGGQDLVAVVATHHFHDGRTVTTTMWLVGVDVRRPIAPDNDEWATTIECLPPTPDSQEPT